MLKLEFPISWNGEEFAEIEVRRPKGKDMRFLPVYNEKTGMAVEDSFPFLSRLLPEGMNEETIDEMDQVDVEALNDLVENFSKKRKRGQARRTSEG